MRVAGWIEATRWRCNSALGSECKISIRLLIMTIAEMDAIVGGYHGDPFRVLGPHRIQKSRGTPRWEVRAFLPQAETAEAVCAAAPVPVGNHHALGLFVATLTVGPRRD